MNLEHSVELLSRIIVGVHLPAELGSSRQPAVHELIRFVIRDIQLEEAGMRQGEGLFAHIIHQAYLVIVAQPLYVNWQTATAPDKLEVSTALDIAPSLKYAPEASNDRMACFVVWECRDALQALERDVLLACAALFECIPV